MRPPPLGLLGLGLCSSLGGGLLGGELRFGGGARGLFGGSFGGRFLGSGLFRGLAGLLGLRDGDGVRLGLDAGRLGDLAVDDRAQDQLLGLARARQVEHRSELAGVIGGQFG